MTRQENIKIIRDACIEANSEIMELKPGCYVRDFFEGAGVVMAIEKDAAGKDCYDIFLTESDPEIIWQQPRGDLDILGRPIRFTDVLLAIKPHLTNSHRDQHVLETIVDEKWNLRADCLNDQSDECLEFLVALLTGKFSDADLA
jgi:hypothetical protein